MKRSDAVLLVVAVAAVSTSAPLVREAAAPALAVAFWRTALASAVIVPVASRGRRSPLHRDEPLTAQRGRRPPLVQDERRAWRLAVLAGLLLAAHFAAWIPSLSLTTVSASVALVATQPVWAALLARAVGARVSSAGWAGIVLALAGVALVTGLDLGTSGRALGGDLLALVGGMLAAAYVSVGAAARRSLSTTDYTACCYSVAAVALLAACAIGRQPLVGFGVRTWLCLLAITAGPQLLGHSVFNRLLRAVGPTVVSVAILAEIVGAGLLAAWWFGESPPPAIVPAAACIVAGVILVVRTDVGPTAGAVQAATA